MLVEAAGQRGIGVKRRIEGNVIQLDACGGEFIEDRIDADGGWHGGIGW